MKSLTPIRELTAAARSGLAGNWGKSIGITFVYMVLVVGVSMIPFAGRILQLIFAAPLVVGFHCYFLATIRSQPNSFGFLFEGFNRFSTSWCAYMLVFLIVMAWIIPFGVLLAIFMPFVHPDPSLFPEYTIWALVAILILTMCGFLILIQMRYYLVLYIVADDPDVRAREAIHRSIQLMKGNYWRLGLLWFRFVGWQMLAALTFGIGLIWLIPYISAATAAFYDDLSTNG
jgi:uncharacterized membrane protein